MKSIYPLLLLAACANPNTILFDSDLQLSAVSQPATLSASPLSQQSPGAGLSVYGNVSEELLSELRMASHPPCSKGPPFERDPAVKYVIDHIDEAHPVLLEMLRNGDFTYDRAFRILVIAGKEESVPVMEEILLSDFELKSPTAGQYLGLHPSKEALAVLLQALSSTKAHTFFGATLGLIERKDKVACAPLRKELTRKDDSQRYYVIQAAGQLGCLTTQELTEISRQDQSDDIRQKAAELLTTHKGSF